MRALGILIAVLLVALIVMVVINRTVIRPARRARHLQQLEEENKRLDNILNRPITKTRERQQR